MNKIYTLAVLGIISGLVSASYFVFFSFENPGNILRFLVPGFAFGVALAVAYTSGRGGNAGPRDLEKGVRIALASTISYPIAYLITFYLTLYAVKADGQILWYAPAAALLGGYVAMTIFVAILRTLGVHYSSTDSMVLRIYGAVLAGLLIDVLVSSQMNQNAAPDSTFVPAAGVYVFFIAWQTIMLVKMGLPLLHSHNSK